MSSRKDKYQPTGIYLMLASLVAWIIPGIGIPVSAASIIVNSKSRHRFKEHFILLSALSLAVGGVNAYIGARQGTQWGIQLQQQLQESPTTTQSETVPAVDSYGYPYEFSTNYTDSCVANGGDYSTCGCSLNLLKSTYSYAQSQEFDRQGSVPVEFSNAVRATCT